MRRWLVPLLLISSIATAWAADAAPKLTPDQQAIATRYSIDPQRQYPGYSVIQAIDLILTNAEAEAKERAADAWGAGYKAAVEQYAPEVAGLEAEVASLRAAKDGLVAERDALLLQVAGLRAELESARAWGGWGAVGAGIGGAALGFAAGRASR